MPASPGRPARRATGRGSATSSAPAPAPCAPSSIRTARCAEEFDVDGYIANVEPFFARNDFYEIEIGQRIERFGQVAHVWSLYEARPAPGSPTLLKRGANSIQLYNDGARWWIVSTVWDNEREDVRFDLW
jgi:hypothetical protein